jgi:hypothetical protein
MQDSDRRAFFETWASAWEGCGKAVTDRLLRFAFESLREYQLADIQRAVLERSRDADTGAFAPKPADIIRQIEGAGDERSLAAWTKVETAITRIGPHRLIAFDDNRIHAVIDDMGGFMRFCVVTDDDLPFMRNEFCKRYRGYVRKAPTRWPALITAAEGEVDEPPHLIGDPELAKRTMLGGGENTGPVEIARLISQTLPELLEKK